MSMSFKNFPMVSKVVFGRGSFTQLGEIMAPMRLNERAPFIYLVDDVFENNSVLIAKIPLLYNDHIIYISTEEEPKTSQVDQLVDSIILGSSILPSGIIGIGGGSLLDLAKAVALMLTNNGPSKDYQGWDLIKNKGVYHVGIPTISWDGHRNGSFNYVFNQQRIHSRSVVFSSNETRKKGGCFK